jgi:hypothetical protein
LYKNHPFYKMKTGVVIAGFGKNEYLPSLIDFEVSYIIDDFLIFNFGKPIEKVSGSSIRPYAQPKMVHTFIRGINPDLDEAAFTILNKIFDRISEDFKKIPQIKNLKKKNKEILINNIKKLHDDNLKSFFSEFNKLIKNDFTDPVVSSITTLPKEELAAVAESLVYLTFLRKRMTEEPENVGGAIDVAVISKGDGFIWIKRKHYFKPELNPHFFKNYFK